MRNRLFIFFAICALCVAGVAAYLLRAKTQTAIVASVERTAPVGPRIFFRYTGVDDHYGKLAVASLDNLGAPHFIENLSCEVVYFAAGQGVCLQADRGVFTTYAAQLFDAQFKTRFTIPLAGGPSRTRVSPDGTLAGWTVFLSGHGYAALDFSTETQLIDLAAGKPIASLEADFAVTRNGEPFKAKDFNFWGLTFTPDSKNFYCTLSSAGAHHLIKGDIAARTATVVHDNVECPSVSPDGKRVAYKKRFIIDDRLIWQLHILDLATQTETPLSEKRSVDDQIEWLDNEHVLYAVSDNPEGSSATTNIWKADAAGKLPPEMFLAKAYSPAVVR